ncbi:MAG: bifunctional helix-turn-helix transcriptional regulator/GNAT family N-acetyltransferase, partial [Pseudomonadota bacterium]
FPLLAALDRYGPLTVGEAADRLGVSQPSVTRTANTMIEADLVSTEIDPGDRRQKRLSLSASGQTKVLRQKTSVWPGVSKAAHSLLGEDMESFLEMIGRIEDGLAEGGYLRRIEGMVEILEFTDELAYLFRDINEEWITDMFALEEADRRILNHPRAEIVDKGGQVYFISTPALGIVGTCALMPKGDGAFELTKMGVLESARGLKIGEKLLAHVLAEAKRMEMKELYLLTNRKCAAAIHLYEKLGFEHDMGVMTAHGGDYSRCDVAMNYPLLTAAVD